MLHGEETYFSLKLYDLIEINNNIIPDELNGNNNNNNNNQKRNNSKPKMSLLPKYHKISVRLHTLMTTENKQDAKCHNLRLEEQEYIMNKGGSSILNYFREYPYYAVVKNGNTKVTYGFSRKKFISIFDISYKKHIKKITSESYIQRYAKLSSISKVEALCPKYNSNLEPNIQRNSNNNNNNNNNNKNNITNTKRRDDCIIPVVFLPYILNLLPQQVKDINNIHDICSDLYLNIFSVFKNSSKLIFNDYTQQYKANWSHVVQENEIKLNNLVSYMSETIIMGKFIKTLYTNQRKLQRQINKLKRKLGDNNVQEGEEEECDDIDISNSNFIDKKKDSNEPTNTNERNNNDNNNNNSDSNSNDKDETPSNDENSVNDDDEDEGEDEDDTNSNDSDESQTNNRIHNLQQYFNKKQKTK